MIIIIFIIIIILLFNNKNIKIESKIRASYQINDKYISYKICYNNISLKGTEYQTISMTIRRGPRGLRVLSFSSLPFTRLW